MMFSGIPIAAMFFPAWPETLLVINKPENQKYPFAQVMELQINIHAIEKVLSKLKQILIEFTFYQPPYGDVSSLGYLQYCLNITLNIQQNI